MTVDWLHHMREAGLTQEQAEAIARLPEDRYVTREHFDGRIAQLDARFAQLLNDLTWRMIGLASVVIVAVGLLDKFVRP